MLQKPSPLGEGAPEGGGWGIPCFELCVSSAKPGAAVEPHQQQFLQTQGPVARNETIKATQILRAGNFLPDRRDNPRNGVRGKATMSTKCSSGAVPGGVLVPLPPWAKELAARRRRNPPCKKRNRSVIAPSSVTASPCHLPPGGGGEAFWGSPLIRPLRGHLPPKGKA